MAKPDCVHCVFMARQQSSEYRCQQHNVTLHTPISLFCRNITPKSDDESYHQWFDESLDADALRPNTLYTWVTTRVTNKQGETQTQVDAEVVGNLALYSDWAAGLFWQTIREVRDKKREQYRKHGYRTGD